MQSPKQNRPRDRKWLDHVRTLPCLLTGHIGEDVDGHHLMTGRGSMGMKAGDDCVIPLRHDLHAQIGTKEYPTEMDVIREHLTNDVLDKLLKAYARELYRTHKGIIRDE